MARHPVLKVRGVIVILERLASSKFGSAAPTSSSGIRMGEAPRFPYTPGRDISPILLRQIAKDIGLTVEGLLHQL